MVTYLTMVVITTIIAYSYYYDYKEVLSYTDINTT